VVCSPSDFASHSSLSSAFDVLATDVDRNVCFPLFLLSILSIDRSIHPSVDLSWQALIRSSCLCAQGKAFVALIEGKNMPIYGAQFHSEKPMYEWWPNEVWTRVLSGGFEPAPLTCCVVSVRTVLDNVVCAQVIQHTHEAITANSYFMGFFVDEARRSTHSFPAGTTIDFIYNYAPEFTDDEFTQCYFW
jgi:hypothetical protein